VSDIEMRKPNYSLADKTAILEKLHAHYDKETISLKELNAFVEKNKIKQFPYFILREHKVARNTFSIVAKNVAAVNSVAPQQSVSAVAMAPVAQVVNLASRRAQNVTESFVPQKNGTYVPFGFYNDLKNIISSRIFYPIYITGLSGNGKTMMIEQVCAALKRELVRVNITKRTDESDLIGSYELIDGSTVRREGPVLTAMRRGAVLLLDECDLGTEDILCLQPILEGKPYFDKKTGEVVHPAAGFTVLATANTKGKGSDDGRFIGTNILNEAFLERFAVTVEQDYPPANTERKILEKNFAELGISDDVFIERLITWAEVIRKSFNDGAVDEIISTRRLVHISKAFSIFKNRLKAIEMCLNRFDTDTKTAFLDLYTKVDADATAPVAPKNDVQVETINDANSGDLMVRVTKNGETKAVLLTAMDMVEHQGQGLTEQQVIDRVAKTLIADLDREANKMPF
jgi:AAA domain (dynein-related subfamily)/CbbQ/NirQ/NorQ C-terminal